jgi:hypothetical protein
VKIGWVGGITHEEDLKLIADDINAMDVEFYIVGYTPSEHWNNIVKLIPKAKICGRHKRVGIWRGLQAL